MHKFILSHLLNHPHLKIDHTIFAWHLSHVLYTWAEGALRKIMSSLPKLNLNNNCLQNNRTQKVYVYFCHKQFFSHKQWTRGFSLPNEEVKIFFFNPLYKIWTKIIFYLYKNFRYSLNTSRSTHLCLIGENMMPILS